MSERGIKKWNAYKSLPEHDPYIKNIEENNYKVEKPYISEEEAEIINRILVHYHGENLSIGYYRNNEIHNIEGRIKKIDPYLRLLTMEDRSIIKLSEIISVKEK